MKDLLPWIALILSTVAVILAFLSGSSPPPTVDGASTTRGQHRDLEQRISSLENTLHQVEQRVEVLGNRRAPRRQEPGTAASPEPFDPTPLEEALKELAVRIEDLETTRDVAARQDSRARNESLLRQLQLAARGNDERSGRSLDEYKSMAVSGESATAKLEGLRALRGQRLANGEDARDRDVILSMIDLVQTSEEADVRADVYRQLSGVTDPVLIDPLVWSLANDSHWKVREEAAETLEDYMPDPTVEAALRQAAENDEHSGVREQAREALEKRRRRR